MRGLKRTLLVLGGAGAALLLVIGVWAVRFDRQLETPESKAWLLDQARQTLGVEVRADRLRASLFRGLELGGVTVANPPGFSGPLLTAQAFTLHHDLWPLLLGRVQVDELSIEKPVLHLAMDSAGFNYERLFGQQAPTKHAVPGGTGAGKGKGPPDEAPSARRGMPLKLAISRLTLRDARLAVVEGRKAPFLTIEGADVDSAFTATGTTVEGGGTARIATMGLAGVLFVRELKGEIESSKQRVRLGPMKGRLAGGTASGELEARLGRAFRYKLALELKGPDVRKLMEEAGSRSSMSGTLEAKGSFEGEGGLATLRGEGRAKIADCRARQAPLLVLLASTLRVSELADPKLDECRLEFVLGGGRARVPMMRLAGPDVRLTGRGVSDLQQGSVDFDMTLALSQALRNRIPIKEMRGAFQEGADGFGALDFKVTGTMAAPRTDIAMRLAKASALDLVKDRLGKLLGRQK